MDSWAFDTNQTHGAINELLDVLRNLLPPKNTRTLLETPISVEVENRCNGQYLQPSSQELKELLQNDGAFQNVVHTQGEGE